VKVNSIKCSVVNVKTESGICPGIAKTRLNEEYIIDGRTPESSGMCSNAFCAISNAAFIMMVTDKMYGEVNGHKDFICPHGFTTFRLERSDSLKSEPFNKK
jgi:hypothetical protein